MTQTSPDRTVAGLVGDRYEITGLIASGGMGSVYRAHDSVLDRTVALKVLKAGADDPEFARRFKTEATNAARLSHPNIVQVYDFGSSDGRPYMAMEYVDGQSLREVLGARGSLRPEAAARIAAQVAQALEHARRAGIVHRDVKPENILVTTDGRVKMADFGLSRALAESKATQAEVIMGTAHYLAPEQVEGTPSDHRSDIYALGVVLYEMLTGRPPFQGDSPVVIAYKRVAEDVPSAMATNPDVPRALDEVIARATARAPEDRYHSPAEMAADLREAVPRFDTGELSVLVHHTEAIPIVGQETISVPRRGPRARKRARRRKRWVVLAVLVALLGVAVITASNNLAKVDVPSVVGLTQQEAEAALKVAGLEATTRVQNSRTVPEGSVISQEPDGGLIGKGSIVTLVISLGPNQFSMPAVEGKPFKEAEQLLHAKGLSVVREDVFHDTVPKLRVIEQTPDESVLVEEGSRVTLTVSKGPEMIAVPDVGGDEVASATADLTTLGFTVKTVEKISETVAKDRVIQVKPKPGTKLAKGSEVTLVVSTGPPLVRVPSVLCMSKNKAEDTLLAAKLAAEFASNGPYVVDQSPAPGEQVPKGSTVVLTLGSGAICQR